MQLRLNPSKRIYFRMIPVIVAAGAVIYFLRKPLREIAILIIGASAIAFLIEPIARFYEKRLKRAAAALAALMSAAAAIIAILWLFLPIIVQETIALAGTLPQSFSAVADFINRIGGWLENHLPGISLPELNPVTDNAVSDIASGTIAIAGNIAGIGARFSLMAVLSYFLLCERSNLLLRMELLVPGRMRHMAVRMGNAVCRELRLYLRGQALVALAVGTLSAFGLLIIGVESALVLGPIIGILNMIPYFGPFIGGIPAVLAALGEGWQKAALAAGMLFLVQQMDSAFISPRIMGNITGLSPATVLIAVFAGAQAAGIVGMLFALPIIMAIRTLFRVFVQKYENI